MSLNSREEKDAYFMQLSMLVAKGSGCLSRQVGAVIVSPEDRVIATGFNDAPVGITPCCMRGSCLRQGCSVGENLQECFAVHAELSAILQCCKYGINCQYCKIYVTTYPCASCMKAIIESGIREVIYLQDYNSPLTEILAREAGVLLRKYEN